MESLSNHLWQSTLFAVAAGVLTVAFKRNRASVRYSLWCAASVKFLVPFALLAAVGGEQHLAPSVQRLASSQMSSAVVQAGNPFSSEISNVPSAQSAMRRSVWAAWGLLCLWLGGVGAITCNRIWIWRRVRAMVRSGSRWQVPPGVDVPKGVRTVATPSLIEPCVIGWWRPVLVVPAGIETN